MIKGFLIQLGLYTTLYSNSHHWDETSYKKGLFFVPFIGLILGGILYILHLLLPSNLEGFILLTAYILLTGGLHMDGFADSLDGLLARRGAKRALEIMKDPLLGSFGILGLIILTLGYYTSLPLLSRAIILFPCYGRLGGMVSALGNDYARPEGMGKLLIESLSSATVFFWLILILALTAYILGISGLIPGSLSLIYSFYKGRSFKRRLGGITGDLIGFVIESTQLVFILSYLLVKLWI